MSWAAQLEAMDNAVLNTFPTTFAFSPQSGGSPQTLTGTIANPAMYEDFVPGSAAGVSVVRLFVRFVDISPSPQHGDQVSINGVSYTVSEVAVDVAGSAVLKLRRNQS